MFIDADGNRHLVGNVRETKPLKTGKEKTYTSRTGLTFGFDINARTIWTSNENIWKCRKVCSA